MSKESDTTRPGETLEILTAIFQCSEGRYRQEADDLTRAAQDAGDPETARALSAQGLKALIQAETLAARFANLSAALSNEGIELATPEEVEEFIKRQRASKNNEPTSPEPLPSPLAPEQTGLPDFDAYESVVFGRGVAVAPGDPPRLYYPTLGDMRMGIYYRLMDEHSDPIWAEGESSRLLQEALDSLAWKIPLVQGRNCPPAHKLGETLQVVGWNAALRGLPAEELVAILRREEMAVQMLNRRLKKYASEINFKIRMHGYARGVSKVKPVSVPTSGNGHADSVEGILKQGEISSVVAILLQKGRDALRDSGLIVNGSQWEMLCALNQGGDGPISGSRETIPPDLYTRLSNLLGSHTSKEEEVLGRIFAGYSSRQVKRYLGIG